MELEKTQRRNTIVFMVVVVGAILVQGMWRDNFRQRQRDSQYQRMQNRAEERERSHQATGSSAAYSR